MATPKHEEKKRLHRRNRNRDRYDLAVLVKAVPELGDFVGPNGFGDDSVDFSNPKAVKLLNTALLFNDYGVQYWEFPDENLCPPVPGRVDYVHYLADLLAEHNYGKIPTGERIVGLDIGMGASCIYPLLGVTEYQWSFIGAEVKPASLVAAMKIVNGNPSLKGHVEGRLQKNPKDVLYGVLGKEEKVDFTMCNPPFHASAEEAKQGTRRKVENLTGSKVKQPALNFSGKHNELVYDGGERKFIHNLLKESKKFEKNCLWFSTLVSKQSNLKGIYQALKMAKAEEVKTIPMGTGNKSSRIVAWTFLNKEERKQWCAERWKA